MPLALVSVRLRDCRAGRRECRSPTIVSRVARQASRGEARCRQHHAVLRDELADYHADAAKSVPSERIAAVVVAYAAAHDDYIDFLDESGYDLDAVFNTPEGKRLAIDTSHSFTVTVVDDATDDCGLDFGGGF